MYEYSSLRHENDKVIGVSNKDVKFTLWCPKKITSIELVDRYNQMFSAYCPATDSSECFEVETKILSYRVGPVEVCLVAKRGETVERCVMTDRGHVMGFTLHKDYIR